MSFDGDCKLIRVNGSASAENEALDFAYSVFGDSAIYYSDFSGNAGERILPGAFTQSLIQKSPKGVWMHQWDQPIVTGKQIGRAHV